MRVSQLLVPLLCVSLTGLAACEKARDRAPTKLDPTKFGAVGEPARVELLSPGAEPRRELRFQFSKGTREQMEMRMTMKSKNEMNGAPMNMDMGMLYDLQTEVADLPSPERANLSFVIEGFKLDPETTTPMLMQGEEMMRSMLSGMKGSMTLDFRGQIYEVGYDLSTVPDAMRQSLSQMEDSLNNMTTSLPDEAVGEGATWRIYQALATQGIEIRQRVDLSLVKIDGETLHLETKIVQDADLQSASMPGLPSGSSAEARSFSSTGTGTMILDLQGIVPVASTTNIKTKAEFKIEMGGTTMDMKMRADTKLTMTRKN